MLLSEVSETDELGSAGTKLGPALGPGTIDGIVGTFQQVPQLQAAGLDHPGVLSLLVPGIAEDRISDLTASVIKRWLTEFTERRCKDRASRRPAGASWAGTPQRLIGDRSTPAFRTTPPTTRPSYSRR